MTVEVRCNGCSIGRFRRSGQSLKTIKKDIRLRRHDLFQVLELDLAPRETFATTSLVQLTCPPIDSVVISISPNLLSS